MIITVHDCVCNIYQTMDTEQLDALLEELSLYANGFSNTQAVVEPDDDVIGSGSDVIATGKDDVEGKVKTMTSMIEGTNT